MVFTAHVGPRSRVVYASPAVTQREALAAPLAHALMMAQARAAAAALCVCSSGVM